MNTASSRATFTDAERARAREIRAFAEHPANLHLSGERLDSSLQGGVFAGVRTAYSISWWHGRRYRACTFSTENRSTPDAATVTAIVSELFGFDMRIPLVKVLDPVDAQVTGVAQPIDEAPERPS